MTEKHAHLQKILDGAIDNQKVFGTSFCLKYRGETWRGAGGNLQTESQYFIASTTKLFVTALVLHLRSNGRIALDNPISKFLGKEILKGLHTLKGIDYSSQITVRHLLAHTSGIPDYFQQKNREGNSLEKELMNGNDRYWSFEEALALSKTMRPLFAPGAKGKAHYSDTNFQLLGKMVETVTGRTVSENIAALITGPLGLSSTYMYSNAADSSPLHLYYKDQALNIPKAMTSFGPDGGIVSTSADMLAFLEAFFNGIFFPKPMIEELRVWNRIFFPMQSGIGIHQFKLPWIFNPFGAIPELIGHSGLSGALAYHSPGKDLYIAGTVNQVAFPDSSFRLSIKLVQQILK
ncbi:MAG: serine hydrolase domain-containing protein [Saprospiraceae bacterium]|nr:beta-lactamase family protein [Saprospiraceae bacterium]